MFSDWFLPGYRAGGPIRSLANLMNHVPARFRLVTRNRDHNSVEPYRDVPTNEWVDHAPNVSVLYLAESELGGPRLKQLLSERDYHRIYLNSLFSPRFALNPLRVARTLGLVSRVLLAPRGMLKPGALSVKAGKKRLFLKLARWTGFYAGIGWHATSEAEAEEIRAHFGRRARVLVAPNISAPAQVESPPQKLSGQLRLVSVARLSREKGIVEALEFLNAANLNGDVKLTLYGAEQDPEYARECRVIASRMRRHDIHFAGELHPDQVGSALAEHHFLYAATRGENYGHAIAEALVRGVPVIISDRTPWKGLEARGVGWDVPLAREDFVRVLRLAHGMSEPEYRRLCDETRRFGASLAASEEVIAANAALFA
ncbi:MAG: hypothetical protein AMXMBFR56_69500 [Polyangiaceae bacterium]